jgi:lactate permease
MTLTIIASLPLVTVIGILTLLQWSAFKALLVGLLVSLIIGIFVWQIPLLDVFASALDAGVSTLDIFLIIFGAVFLFQGLEEENKISEITKSIKGVSSIESIQVLLLTWGLVSFFEGVAGFGTPAAIVAPILVLLGIKPVLAVILSLLGDSAAVVFGAVGTPIIGGYQGLESATLLMTLPNLLQGVGVQAAFLNMVLLSFMPVVMMLVYGHFQNGSIKTVRDALPIAFISGILLTSIQWLSAMFLGPEIPSALAGFLSLLLFFIGAPLWRGESKTQLWKRILKLGKTWAPYLSILFLLLITRLPILPLKELLMTGQFQIEKIFQTSTSLTWRPLVNPGLFPFIPVTLLFCHSSTYPKAIKKSWSRLKSALPVLFFGIFMVGLMNLNGAEGKTSMILTLAQAAAQNAGHLWHLVAPFIGALGSFVSGSATVSNIMFGNLQLSTANLTGLSPVSTLALQSFGGAIGNLICLHNIVAALAVTGHSGREAEVLRTTLPIALIFCFVAGLFAWFTQ